MVAAGVRLGVVGPYAAQRVLWTLAVPLQEAMTDACGRALDQVGGFAPDWELAVMQHEELNDALFQT
jgi:urease accessory protein UreF